MAQTTTTTEQASPSEITKTQPSTTTNNGMSLEVGAAPSALNLDDVQRYTPSQVLWLQRTVGNQAVQRLLRPQPPQIATGDQVVQTKLTVGPAKDRYEEEADTVANQVMRSLQKPASVQGVQRQPKRIQRMAGPEGGKVDAPVESSIKKARGGGQKIDDGFRKRMENGFGASFGNVRVHTDARADQLNRSLNARAFTTGSDIFFKQGEYKPGSSGGQKLIAHELTHVVQQGATSQAKVSRMPASGRIMRDFAPEHKTALLDRLSSLDYDMLTAVAAKAPLIQAIDDQPPTQIPFTDREMLKQLVLVSPEKPTKIQGYLTKALDKNNIGDLFNKLRSNKSLSSGPVYTLIAESRQIINEGNRRGSDEGDLNKAATAEDGKDDSVYKDRLVHKKKRFLRKAKTVQHSFTDLMGKVKAIAKLNLNDLTVAFVKGGNIPQPTKTVEGKDVKPITQEEVAPHIGVAGGGPLGLMAAIESRMQGAQVSLFEGRSNEYSRRQILKLETATLQKLRKFGIYDELFGKEDAKGNETDKSVAVMFIENALKRRALELGVRIHSGFYLVGANENKDETNKVDSIFESMDDQLRFTDTFDLLIVAAGAGIANKNAKTGVTLKDELGFEYKVQRAKDYAVTGLFKPVTEGVTGKVMGTPDWKYRFDSPKVTYMLHQVSKEKFDEFGGEKGTKLMQEFTMGAAKDIHQIENPELAPDKNEKNQRTPNVGRFLIQIQQAKKFVNEKLSTLVIGDSAATPHPDSGSGFNTGVAELDALGGLVESMRQQKLMSVLEKRAGESLSSDEDKAKARQTGFDNYNQELKNWTDKMVGKALSTMKTVYFRKLKTVYEPWVAKYAELPTYSTIMEKVAFYKAEALKIYSDSSTDRETLVNRLLDMYEEALKLTKEYDAELLSSQYDEYMRNRVDEI